MTRFPRMPYLFVQISAPWPLTDKKLWGGMALPHSFYDGLPTPFFTILTLACSYTSRPISPLK